MKDERLYYYTDFNTFKLMLQNGTLRFKESNSSNDRLDTVQLYDNLHKMAEEKVKDTKLKAERKFYFDMLRHNGAKSSRVFLVSCFTSKADSRMLWDAYTMHRKDRTAERYNGVCIEINKRQLIEAMENVAEIFDVRCCKEIIYGFEGIDGDLERIMESFSKEVEALSKDKDQKQDIVPPILIPSTKKMLELKKCIVIPTLHLIDELDIAAPFYKHHFWREECETRALLSVKRANKKANELKVSDDKSLYYDLSISKECISKVILGPEVFESDIEELNSINGVIKFEQLHSQPSEGTNVITNR